MSEINKAVGILTEMTEKSPNTLYMGIYSTHEANEAIRLALSELSRLREENATLSRERDEAREALQPFVAAHFCLAPGLDDSTQVALSLRDLLSSRFKQRYFRLTIGDFRRAATLSRQSKEGGE